MSLPGQPGEAGKGASLGSSRLPSKCPHCKREFAPKLKTQIYGNWASCRRYAKRFHGLNWYHRFGADQRRARKLNYA